MTLNTAQIFDLTDSVGRYVRFNITSNHGRCCAGIAELAFDISNVTTVPVMEPASIALLGLGLAGIGFLREKKAAPLHISIKARNY